MIALKIVGIIVIGFIALTGICAFAGLIWMFWAGVWEDLQSFRRRRAGERKA